jgi:NADH dehydrogenase
MRAAAGVQAVIHLAAVTHARRAATYTRVNAVGTANLVAASEVAGVGRFVLVSTRAIGAHGGAYSESKREAERIVAHSRLPHTIVRLPEVYGAGGAEGVDGIIARVVEGRTVPIVAGRTATVCPIPLDAATSAVVAALMRQEAVGRTYTLAGRCMTVEQFAQACIRSLSSTSTLIDIPITLVRLLSLSSRVLPLPIYPDQVARLLADKPGVSPEAARDLDFDPPSVEEVLRSIVGRD